MKKFMFSALFAVSVNGAIAQSQVEKVNDASLNVRAQQASVVKVYDLTNGLIHTEAIGSKKSRTFNMEMLSDGDYMLEVQDTDYYTSVQFNVPSAGTVVFKEPVTVGLPKITQKGTSIHVVRAGKESSDKVSIFNSSDELIFEEVMTSLNRGQKLDLSNVKSGTYYITIATNGKVFDHTISIGDE